MTSKLIKSFIPLVALLVLSCSAISQTISRQVIGAGGGQLRNSDSSKVLLFEIGESITPTLISGNFVLTQGFEQPDSLKRENFVFEISYQVFPNPSSTFVKIQVKSPEDVTVNLFLSDLVGKKLINKAFILKKNQMLEKTYQVENLAAGMYTFTFYSELNKELHSIKWIKI
jgi:Secretion system C-terminal sorting domain